jgi:hypothetical protein
LSFLSEKGWADFRTKFFFSDWIVFSFESKYPEKKKLGKQSLRQKSVAKKNYDEKKIRPTNYKIAVFMLM